MLKKNFFISKEQRGCLLSTANYVKSREGPKKYRVEIIAKNKERIPVEPNITPMKDEEGVMVVVVPIC